MKDEGIRAFAYPGDITDQASVQHMVDQIEKQLGPIYLLVNVAGILRMGSIDQLSADDWQQTFRSQHTWCLFTYLKLSPNT
ncbi:hypothetical protein BsIDN1_71310 [Bacillus safensis]|uniref:Ketoreductase (KR) domain-containing protein n=1 Tax=Bacillus safensis TaxID=561879 RepID=A0A5S9MK95_BACIA|nr:hypothetical protein BsIDN1_71310 [Bacillus safensis]